jgi:hypothetical protein
MSDDADGVALHVEKVLPLDTARLGNEYFYQSLPLCVVDAVYSINARYSGVQNVLARYCKRFGLRTFRAHGAAFPPIDEQESISQFCARAEQFSPERLAAEVFENRQRTSARSGILKAEASYRFACILRAHRIEYFQQASVATGNARLECDLGTIPGDASGARLQYFWMLAGSDDLIKPDRWVVGFLESVVRHSVDFASAQALVTAAVERLKARHKNLTPHMLDYMIWDYQRGVGKSPRNS